MWVSLNRHAAKSNTVRMSSECSATLAHSQEQSKNTYGTEQNSHGELRIDVGISERLSCEVEYSQNVIGVLRNTRSQSRTVEEHIRNRAELSRRAQNRCGYL